MSKQNSLSKQKANYTVGIDLGGTKVAAALVDDQGRILSEVHKRTVPPWMQSMDPRRITRRPRKAEVEAHIEYVVSTMAEAAAEIAEPIRGRMIKGRILGIGLASAGPMNIQKGTLEYPANFVGWKKVPIVDLLAQELKQYGFKEKVSFQNDAIAAALGEGWIGRAKERQTFATITVGTGIGSGVIFNGRPAQFAGMGSEWGHLIANAPGISMHPETLYERTVEGLASGTGMIRRAKARGFYGSTTQELATAARNGDLIAREIFLGASEGLATLFYGLSLGFHPEMLIITGGLLGVREFFLPQAIEIYRDLMKRKNPEFLAPVRISKLGNRAGVIGAARLPWLEAYEKSKTLK